MAECRLSNAADADIESIILASIERWGIVRAEAYIRSLHETFTALAAFPAMGRDAGHIRPRTLYMASGSHTVFYRKTGTGIFIIRVLHQRMDFAARLLP